MTLSNVSIYKHGGEWKFASESALSESLKQEFSKYNNDLNELTIYLMSGNTSHFGVINGKSSYYVFLDALPSNKERHVETIKTVKLPNGEEYALKEYFEPNEKVEPVKNKQGQIIAYTSKTHSEIYLPFKLNEFSGEELNKVVFQLLKEVNKVLFEDYELRDSWTLKKNRERLMSVIEKNHTIDIEREIRILKTEIESKQRQLDDYRTSMKTTLDKIADYNRKLIETENQPKDNGEKFAEQLNLIADYPGVKKIELDGKKIKISIDDVYAYARVKAVTRRYYIGNMRIEINMSNSDVRFFNTNNPRRGYWTTNDPHPHVDGGNGYPCLGNVSATIAELASTKEIYALFLTTLDFLQNANTDDVAGRTITSWDEVDEQGNKVENQVEINICGCERCGEETDETTRVYTSYEGDGCVGDGEDWCEECADDYAYFSDDIEEYTTESVSQQLDEYYEEEEE